MEPPSPGPYFILVWFGSVIAAVSAWGAWMLYRKGPSVLRRLSSALCALAFVGCLAIVSWSIWKLGQPRDLDPQTAWLPQAHLTITIRDADRAGFIDEVAAFAKERGARINSPPEPNQTRMTFHVELSSQSFFGISNYHSSSLRDVNITAYSHDRPDVWTDAWKAIVERLTAGFGKDQVKVRKTPP